MKPISYKQSRKNSARRGRKAKVRRARARGGRAGSKPVFGLGRIHLEIGDRIGAMSFGGIGVMRRLVSRLGLVREIDRRLHLPGISGLLGLLWIPHPWHRGWFETGGSRRHVGDVEHQGLGAERERP